MPDLFSRLIRAALMLAPAASFATATPATTNSSPWLARAWQSDDGLPDNSISGVAQTPEGFFWVATHGGLVRFDGARFEELSPVNIAGVPNRVVRALFRDGRGRLWLGMDRGPVVCVTSDTARVFTASDGLPDLQIAGMAEDREERIWIGYANGDLFRIKEDGVTRFGARDGLPAGGACWLTSDSRGNLWFAKDRQIGVFRDGRFHTLLTLDEPAARIGAARTGGMWICSGPRLLKYDGVSGADVRGQLPTSRPRIEPSVVFEDHAGAVWIGTAASGLFRYDGSSIKTVETSHREIWCLTEDREGNIWAGTGGGGLNQLRPRPLELVGIGAGLPFESVRSVCEDAAGKLWVVTQNGSLARQESDGWVTLSVSGGWTGGHAWCVAADRDGAVWVGTRERGLHRLESGQFSAWRKEDGLASDAVRSLLPSSTGDLWIGTDSPNQVQRLCEGRIHTLEMPQPARFIRAMTEDSDGTIWIGTAEGQLLRVKGNTLVTEPEAMQGRPLSIRCLHATDDGSLWIGYAGAGVGRVKAGQYFRIDAGRGLHDNYISRSAATARLVSRSGHADESSSAICAGHSRREHGPRHRPD